MVHAGLAYAWLPEHAIAQPINKGQLVKLALTEGDMQEARLKVILNPSKSQGEVVTTLRDQLMKVVESKK